MVLVGVITKIGIQSLLAVGFGGNSGNQFTHGAVGKSTTVPTVDSLGLGQEVAVADNVNYSRVELVNTPDAVVINRMKSEMTFDTTNINPEPGSAVTIKEIAIYDGSTIGEGIPWCILQVGNTDKDNTKSVKFTIYSTITPV